MNVCHSFGYCDLWKHGENQYATSHCYCGRHRVLVEAVEAVETVKRAKDWSSCSCAQDRPWTCFCLSLLGVLSNGFLRGLFVLLRLIAGLVAEFDLTPLF